MKVKWFPEALLTLRQTAKYIRKNFGEKSSNTFLQDIFKYEKLLLHNPKIGPRERYLENTKLEYRSIVVKPYNKIVYLINSNTIEIVAIWDCRREPDAQARSLQ